MKRIPIIMKDFANKIPGAPDWRMNVQGSCYVVTLFIAFLLSSSLAHAVTSKKDFNTSNASHRIFTNKPPVAVDDKATTNENSPVSGNVLTNDYDPDGGTLHAKPLSKNTAHGKVVLLADGTFTYTPNTNFHGEDSFTYDVCDNFNACCTATVKITVVCVQDPPVGVPDFFSVNEDTQITNQYNVLTNDTDADGQSLTAVLGKTTQHGTLVLNSNGTFTYKPNLNYNGTDTFTYYANDGTDKSAETLVTITVIPVNDAPVAANDAITTDEDVAVVIPVLANDTDVEDALVVSMIVITTQPAHGTVNINTATGKVTYTPSPNYYGPDAFEYKIKDTGGAFSNVAKVTITVNPVNDPPTVLPDVVVTPEDVVKVITVLANDTDVDNAINPGSVTVVSNPSHGVVVPGPTPGTFSYTPSPDYYGNDSFSYTVKDVSGAVSLPGVVSITVTPVNDKPVAVNDAVITDEDVPVSIAVLANDSDVDDVLTGSMIVIVTPPAHGTLSVDPVTGKVTYTPAADYFGSDSFQYQLKDAAGALSNVATVSITVNPVADVPVATPDFATTPEDVPVVIAVTANDLKNGTVNLNPGSVAVVSAPSHGTVVAGSTPGSFLYTPDQNYFGTDSFTYTVKDVNGVVSLPGVVSITVTPVNDKPVAVNDAVTTDEDVPVSIAVLANDSDVEDVLTGSMIVIVTAPVHGTVIVDPVTGKVTYTPAADYFGSDSFQYQLKDAAGALSNVATVSITVNPVADLPVASPDFATTPEDVAVVIPVTANDIKNGSVNLNPGSVAVVTGASKGTVVASSTPGSFAYVPNQDYFGSDSFTYTVKDMNGVVSLPALVTITITPVNDAPVANNDAATTDENIPVGIPVLANDFDVDSPLDPTSLVITTNPQHGTVLINTGSDVELVTYSPATGYSGNDSFAYRIKDDGGLVSNPATVSISVINVNAPPVAVDDAVTHTSQVAVSIDVLANDYDPDNAHSELSIVTVTDPSVGTVSIVDGEIVYTPEGTSSTTVTFTYTITDPGGLTDEGTVTINYIYTELLVSQGFSPNGDGNNDTWYIKGIESYPNNLVKVFDRWGLQVYQKSGYENSIAPWNGYGNIGQQAGKKVERGTYFYTLEPGGGLKRLEGYVMVVY